MLSTKQKLSLPKIAYVFLIAALLVGAAAGYLIPKKSKTETVVERPTALSLPAKLYGDGAVEPEINIYQTRADDSSLVKVYEISFENLGKVFAYQKDFQADSSWDQQGLGYYSQDGEAYIWQSRLLEELSDSTSASAKLLVRNY